VTKASRETEELLNAIVKVRFFYSYLLGSSPPLLHPSPPPIHPSPPPFTQVYLLSAKNHRRVTQA
jgi:hypothetical protein